MAEFQPGDIVDVAIKGVRVVGVRYDERYDSAYLLTAIQINGDEAHGRVHLDGEGITVSLAVPDVRIGDLWRDAEDDLWFVTEGDDESPEMRGTAGGTCDPRGLVKSYGPLTLVHRETSEAAS